MAATRNSRLPIALAIVTITFLLTLWHGRDKLPEYPLHYIKGSFSGTRPSFYEIAKSHGTDKVNGHHYERMYERRLAPFRDKKIKMLEIGLGCDMGYGPGASYYTWLEYFPYVDLYYIEYNAECAKKWENKTEKAHVYTGDQADVAFLNEFIMDSGGRFDIIIDDGGHSMLQQRVSLNILWATVKAGGIYFVEDLATSYLEHYGGGYGTPDTFMGDLKDILDDLNKAPGIPVKSAISNDVIAFEFTQEVVALTKGGVD